ncbi:CLAVATA3/ESR (CLE)-related protein 13 [Spatholobus suberectus]|nr:CLAVATA3/ESR (CLE)-related protein 13 [Spatholobus suberectus]
MALIIRFQHVLSFILWLFLFFVLFHGWFGFKSNNDNAVISNNHQLQLSVSRNRKILAAGRGFDFTPFLHHHRRHHHRRHHHRSHKPEPKATEIDPRYGVEKRLVPTGPNPLHH